MDDKKGQVAVNLNNVLRSTGANNDYLKQVGFTFGAVGYKQAVLRLQDASDPTRFEIPEDIVKKADIPYQYRLDMVGFELQDKPFSFSFKSTANNEKLIDTFNQTFVMQDKYTQIDMAIPSNRVYGFGERESGFALGEGAWSMWA